MKKKISIGLIILVLISIIIVITIKLTKTKSNEEKISKPIDYVEENKESQDNKEEQEKISQMINNQGFKSDENIYEIDKEYDGREVVVVKAGIQYKVALAGLLKRSIPEFNEINEILSKAPTHTGIWIEETSREKFLNILKNITNAKNWRMNKYDKKIQKILSEEKLVVFDISSKTYLVDDVTGKIGEYPFEEIDPYSGYEHFESDNKGMFIISENISGKINQEDVLKGIFE